MAIAAANQLSALATLAGLYILAVASPGPNVLILSQLALAGHKSTGNRVAFGITLGSTLWCLFAMAGVSALFSRVGFLLAAVRFAGASYLIWLGGKLLWKALRADCALALLRSPIAVSGRSWRSGLLTSLANPKSAAFWTSLFASVFPAHAPPWMFAATAALVALISAAWHFGIVHLLAAARIQAVYRAWIRPIDALCGTLLVAIGARLAAAR
jgi:threonine/homoserine/homoserine lactone efflux protein